MAEEFKDIDTRKDLEDYNNFVKKRSADVKAYIQERVPAQDRSTLMHLLTEVIESLSDDISNTLTRAGRAKVLPAISLFEDILNYIFGRLRGYQQAARTNYGGVLQGYEKKQKPLNQGIASFVALQEARDALVDDFDALMDKINAICLNQGCSYYDRIRANPKKDLRMFYKAFYLYSKNPKNFDGHLYVTDALRATFVFGNFQDLYRCFNAVQKQIDVARVKDRFNGRSADYGYRDLLFNVRVGDKRVLVCEVQFQLLVMNEYKSEMHKFYNRCRAIDVPSRGDHKTNYYYQLVQKLFKPSLTQEDKEGLDQIIKSKYL